MTPDEIQALTVSRNQPVPVAQQNPMMDPAFLEYFAQLPPDQRQAIFRPFGDEQAALQQQMAQADALMGMRAEPRRTAGGAIGEGLGVLGANITGAIRSKDLQGQQKQLLKDKQTEADTRVSNFAQWYAGQMGGQGQGPDMARQRSLAQALRGAQGGGSMFGLPPLSY